MNLLCPPHPPQVESEHHHQHLQLCSARRGHVGDDHHHGDLGDGGHLLLHPACDEADQEEDELLGPGRK